MLASSCSIASSVRSTFAKAVSTEVLHEARGGKPAITLTCYKYTIPMRFKSECADRFFQPLPTEDHGHHVSNVCPNFDQDNAQKAEPCHISLNKDRFQKSDRMEELRCELDKHFESLKDEFEDKTGKQWTPLRSCDDEGWEWIEDVDDDWEWEEDFV